MRAPLAYRAYVGLTALAVPFFARAAISRLRNAGVPVVRTHEKLGHATENRRGTGALVWFHAASVGESLSVLALITRIGERLPQAQFLITSGTATSAKLVAARMPPRCVHQFAPLDSAGPVTRFLDHWRPDAAIFVESEIWPQMLRRTHARGVPMALVNARLSAASRRNWLRFPKTAAYVLEVFDLILSQNDAMAHAMVALNAPAERVARGINLKSLSTPLPVDEDIAIQMQDALEGRPVWVAASTHEGEEQIVLSAHARLLREMPELCLILAPRHPQRGDAVSGLIAAAGLSQTRRTAGGLPDAQVYLADTMGELGTWYALASFVFLGGSLLPIGGHNPFEVAQAGAAVLSGPHVANFSETFADLQARGGVRMLEDADDLAAAVATFLRDPKTLAEARDAARHFVAQQDGALDQIATRLIRALKLDGAA